MRLFLLLTVVGSLALSPGANGQAKAPNVHAWGITFSPDCSEQDLRKKFAESKIDLVPVNALYFDLQRNGIPIGEVGFAGGRVFMAKQTWFVSRDQGAIAFVRGLLDAVKSIAAKSGTDAEFGEEIIPDASLRWANFMFAGKRISVSESDFPLDGQRVHIVTVKATVF
ncbi:MAG TPA: hypothetical protein VME43_15570 [Bryobacteraceae bacterium]|nr:hypothetical protein [Bryobacteraceae bacterium]